MNLNRLIISIFLIIFSLQSLTKADDISDFQIEGMSVGDNLLDHISITELNNSKKFYYKRESYIGIVLDNNFKDYDDVQITYKKDNQNFIIYSVTGRLFFENSLMHYPQCSFLLSRSL